MSGPWSQGRPGWIVMSTTDGKILAGLPIGEGVDTT
jgi:hypothetical protein